MVGFQVTYFTPLIAEDCNDTEPDTQHDYHDDCLVNLDKRDVLEVVIVTHVIWRSIRIVHMMSSYSLSKLGNLPGMTKAWIPIDRIMSRVIGRRDKQNRSGFILGS